MLFLWLSTLLSATAIVCPTVLCEEMTDNTCAQVYSDVIKLRSHHCLTTTYCNLTAVLSVVGQLVVPCESFADSEIIYDDNDYRDCGLRVPKRNLVVGAYPKVCDSDSDCLLQDGAVTACKCGLNGKAYCVPDLSSSLLNQYWKKCESPYPEKNVVYRNDYYYWMWYLEFYPLIVSAPSCAWSVSIELLTFRYLDAFLYRAAAASLCLCVWGLLG